VKEPNLPTELKYRIVRRISDPDYECSHAIEGATAVRTFVLSALALGDISIFNAEVVISPDNNLALQYQRFDRPHNQDSESLGTSYYLEHHLSPSTIRS